MRLAFHAGIKLFIKEVLSCQHAIQGRIFCKNA